MLCSVFTRVIFLTRKMMPSIRKDRLPFIQRSNVVYTVNTCATATVRTSAELLKDWRTESINTSLSSFATKQTNCSHSAAAKLHQATLIRIRQLVFIYCKTKIVLIITITICLRFWLQVDLFPSGRTRSNLH